MQTCNKIEKKIGTNLLINCNAKLVLELNFLVGY